MPGLVEGHSHLFEGSVWALRLLSAITTAWIRTAAVWPGATSIEAVDRAAARGGAGAMTDAARPVVGWALDPIYFGARRVSRADLDRVSTDAPGRRDACQLPHPERQHEGARTRRAAAPGHQSSRRPARRRTACRPAS